MIGKGGMNPKSLESIVKNSKGVKKIDMSRATGLNPESGFFDGIKGWRNAEEYLRNGTVRPGRYPQPSVSGLIRYPDAVIGDVIMEAKTGYVKNCERIRTQIGKDKRLIDAFNIDGAEWHFFASGRSNSIGADQTIINLLKANNIPYYIHLP